MQVDNSSEGHLLEDFDNNESKLKGRNATTFGATINLMNTVPNLFIKLTNKIVGGGILALPFAFRQTGLTTGRLLATLSLHHKVFTYREICDIYLGKKGSKVVDIFGVLFLVGACIAYLMVIGDMLTPFLDFIFGRASDKMFLAIPIFNFAFTIQLSFFPLMKEMEQPEEINKSLALSMGNCLCLYLMTGSAGYLNFRENTNSNILTNYEDEDILIAIARLALAILIIFSYPILAFPARTVIDSLLFKTEAPLWRRMIEANLFVIFTYLFAIAIPGIDYVFEVVGTTSGNLVMYILPGFFTLVFKLKQNGNFSTSPILFIKNSAKLQYVPYISLVLLGIIFVILGLVSMVIAITLEKAK